MIVNFILDYRPGVAVIIEKGPHKDICGKVSIFFKCTHCCQSHVDKFIPYGILTSERCVFFFTDSGCRHRYIKNYCSTPS